MSETNPKALFEHIVEVTAADIGALGLVDNATFIRFTERCAARHADAVGLVADALHAHGVVPVVKRHEISYHRAAKLGDSLTVSSRIVKMSGPEVVRHAQVRLAATGDLVADALSEWLWLEPRLRRPRRAPQSVLEAFGFSPPAEILVPSAQADSYSLSK